MSALAPFDPDRSNPWDKTLAAHLLNRAGFGALPEEIDQAVGWGLSRTVDYLVDFDKVADADFPVPEMPDPEWPKKKSADAGKPGNKEKVKEVKRDNHAAIDDIRAWWVRRMIRTKRPLQEKMTLFWHGHLTTSAEDVQRARLLLTQNEFLRENCLASFRDLLLGISQDPAMLAYLNNNTSRKQHPNENYARELMELFTMGIGNYTEDDVKAAARAFTGWTFRDETYVFNEHDHDSDSKTYLGHTGDLDGTDVIDIILEQPCTAGFMARKLLRFFVCDDPAPQEVEDFASVIREHDYDFKTAMRALLSSEVFFSPRAFRTQIKSPAQLVVGTARTLGVTVDEHALVIAMRALGQNLLYPPTVKGWDGGERWVNTQTLLMRYNFAGYLIEGKMGGQNTGGSGKGQQQHRFQLDRYESPQTQLAQLCGPELAGDATRLVNMLTGRLLYTRLDAKAHQWLVERAEDAPTSDRPAVVAHLIMSMPDYQLC